MDKYITNNPKLSAIYNAMPSEMKERLRRNIKSLEAQAPENPAIAKMLSTPAHPNFDDIPIDVNLSITDIIEQLRSIENIPKFK